MSFLKAPKISAANNIVTETRCSKNQKKSQTLSEAKSLCILFALPARFKGVIMDSGRYATKLTCDPSPITWDPSFIFPETINLPLQLRIARHDRRQIGDVNDPRERISGKKVGVITFHRMHLISRSSSHAPHRTLPRGAISDSSACAWSTSRCSFSSRYRDQHTRNAKQENASQLISSTCNMRGSIDPPPPITGCGCCVRKNQIEK